MIGNETMEPVDCFIAFFKWHLKERGIKQSWVAEKLGVAPSKLNDFLAKRAGYTQDVQGKTAEILGIEYWRAIKAGSEILSSGQTRESFGGTVAPASDGRYHRTNDIVQALLKISATCEDMHRIMGRAMRRRPTEADQGQEMPAGQKD